MDNKTFVFVETIMHEIQTGHHQSFDTEKFRADQNGEDILDIDSGSRVVLHVTH